MSLARVEDVTNLAVTVGEALAQTAAKVATAELMSKPYGSYMEALNSIKPLTQIRVSAIVSGTLIEWIRDENGTCLGGGWSPDRLKTPLHWGAVGDGITDDRVAVQSAINSLVKTSTSKPDAFNNSPASVISGSGKQYAISGPVYVGNVGNGAGMIYHSTISDLKLVAIPGDWAGNIVPGISKQMLIVAWRMTENYSDLGAGLFNIHFERVTLDCRYLTGGIYFENTNSCSYQNSRIGRIGKNRVGYDTGRFRVSSGHPTGLRIGNGALLVENLNIGGLEEEADESFAAGEDQISMGTIGMRHQTNDARLNNIIISRVTDAAIFDHCGAVQVANFHPWSRAVTLGSNTANFMFSNCYFDFTRFRIIGSFDHFFVGCHWILGENALGNGLELVAISANTTGSGLILSGCRFRADIGINFVTEGSGSWVADRARKIEMVGCKFDTNVPAYVGRMNGMLVKSDGTVEVVNSDMTAGRAGINGNFLALGTDRTTLGYTGIEMFDGPGTHSFRIVQFSSHHVNIVNDRAGEIRIGNSASSKTNAITIQANGNVRVTTKLSIDNIRAFPDDTSAKSGGLSAGDIYQASGVLRIVR